LRYWRWIIDVRSQHYWRRISHRLTNHLLGTVAVEPGEFAALVEVTEDRNGLSINQVTSLVCDVGRLNFQGGGAAITEAALSVWFGARSRRSMEQAGARVSPADDDTRDMKSEAVDRMRHVDPGIWAQPRDAVRLIDGKCNCNFTVNRDGE
jgi:hypothetical protein